MNELINNLRLDAGISRLKDDSRLVVIDREGNVIDPLIGLEKFAKLIVRECMTICKNHPSRIVSNNWNADAVAPDIVHRLSDHFGVEE